MRRLGALLGSALALGCGRIEAPVGAVDPSANPEALRAAFDDEVGVPHLVLLLSPA